MKEQITFDHVLTHDTDRRKFDPRTNERNYKVASVGEVHALIRRSGKRSIIAGYSRDISLTDDYDKPIDPLLITAKSRFDLNKITHNIKDIAVIEDAARKLASYSIGESSGTSGLQSLANQMRQELKRDRKIKLPK